MLALGACSYKLRVVRSYPFKLRPEDSVFIDRTVAVYDAFVRSRMGDTLTMGEAYRRFFVENAAKVESLMDIDTLFMPDSTFVYRWTSDFVGGKSGNSFVRPCYFSPPEPWETVHPQSYGRWFMQMDYYREGIKGLSEVVCKVNPAWDGWRDITLAAGDFWVPYTVGMGEQINFDNKHERFLAVIAFMTGCLDHRDFNLVKDVARNDSLKAAWQIEIERRREDSLYDEN